MGKYRLFVVFTPYQLLNAINFVINKPEIDDLKNDILLDVKVYATLPKNYKQPLHSIFKNIYECRCRQTNKYSLNEVNRLSSAYKGKRLYKLFYFKNFLKEKIAHISYKISKTLFLKVRIHPGFNPYKYKDIYTYNIPIIIKTIFRVLYKNNVRTVHIMEDGIGIYTGERQAEFFANTYTDLTIVSHMYDPDLKVYPEPITQIEAMPKLSRSNRKALECLNKVFGYDIDNVLLKDIYVVVLDQDIENYCSNASLKEEVYKLKVELFQIAVGMFKKNLLLKVHPLSLTGPQKWKSNYESSVINDQINKYPLELIILNTDKCPCLISISSTASFTPFYAIDTISDKGDLILLDHMFRLDEINVVFVNAERFIDGVYKKHKFHRPKSKEEYISILKSISI